MKKDKMSERLSELQVCDLVKIYKEYECLWDNSNVNYKNREVRDNAYKEIFEKVNIPGLKVTDIPQKIKNIRTSYYTELRKVETSIKGRGKVYKPKVAWFPIADEMLRKLSRSQNVETESEPESNIITTKKDKTQKSISTLDKIATKGTPQSISTQRSEPQSTSTQKSEPQNTSTKRSEPQTKYYKDDEFDSYGKYIALSLRSMPRETSIIARMELQRTIAEIQLKALRQEERVTKSVSCGPSTSKMDEDPLEDPLVETVEIKSDFSLSNVKAEEEG